MQITLLESPFNFSSVRVLKTCVVHSDTASRHFRHLGVP